MRFWKSLRAVANPSVEDSPLLRLSATDAITVRDGFEGIGIFGGTGSGKTSASGYQIARAMLELGFGGLVLTVKVDEAARWKRLCEETGRLHDLMIFDQSGSLQFNFLSYQLQEAVLGSEATENLISQIEEMVQVANRYGGVPSSRGDEPFWVSQRRSFARNAIDLVRFGTGSVSIGDVLEVITDAPRSLEEANDRVHMQNNTVGMLLKAGRERCTDSDSLHDLELVEEFFLSSFAKLADKTRSIIEASLIGVLEPLCRGKLFQLFGRGQTATPDNILEGKIIVVNLPVKQFGIPGLVGQTIWKSQFQQRVEQRREGETKPCFTFVDEAQSFLTLRDMYSAATARSSRCISVWLTQNISNVYVSMGGDETGKAATESLLGLVQTKIFHQNSDSVTNQWASDLIGRRLTRMRSSTITPSSQTWPTVFPQQSQVNATFTQSYEYAVQPSEFASMRKGGQPHGYAEAIVFQGGRAWDATGDIFCRARIKQGY